MIIFGLVFDALLAMKKLLLVFALVAAPAVFAQELTLSKGKLQDSLVVNDSISESFALYLPKNFELTKKWPVIFVFDMQSRGKRAASMLISSAENEGYVVAASNSINNKLTITSNVRVASRMMNRVAEIIPVHTKRIYAAGFSGGARFASLLPTFISSISGVLSCGAAINNIEVLNPKKPFHFIGVVGVEDYNYSEMLTTEKVLNKMKFPNQLFAFQGGSKWPSQKYITMALQTFTLSAMAKGNIEKNDDFIQKTYNAQLVETNDLLSTQPLMAQDRLWGVMEIFQPHKNIDSLKLSSKTLRKTKHYRSQKRSRSAAMFKESLTQEDFAYYLEEDVLTYNYNNLGWWKYQMEELKKYQKSPNQFEKNMGKRLEGYLNALMEDNLDILTQEKTVDLEAVNFIYMLKTITAPATVENYFAVISNSTILDDFGTALFYLEELLKTGFTDTEKIYTIENTALLRITPEFNEIVEKYLKDARYEPIEE